MDQAARERRIKELEDELRRVNAHAQHTHSVMDKVQYDQLKKQIETQITLEQQNKDQAEMKAHIVGNGKPGLLTRVDRLEQSEKARVWFWRAIVTAMLGLAGLAIVQILVHAGLK